MKVNLEYKGNMKITGTTPDNHETKFDAKPELGGEQSAPTPMEIFLESMGSCSLMDVISILKKKRKDIIDLKVEIDGERAETHPKVFTKVTLTYSLISNNAELADLERVVDLSQNSYCSASAMFQRAGCEIVTICKVTKP